MVIIGPLPSQRTNAGFVPLKPRSAESRLLHPSARFCDSGLRGIQGRWDCNAAIDEACLVSR